jgi:hypothetical protein
MRQNALTALASAAILALPAAPAGTTINFPAFAGAGGLTLTGSATVTGGVLRLTSGRRDQAGAAWASATVDPRSAFDTTFDVITSGPPVHADGFAFVVQSDGSRALGGLCGSIGDGGMPHSLAVEFDTYRNRDDVDGNHVAVVTGGRSDPPQADAAPSPTPLFGDRLHVRIGYAPGTLTVGVRRGGEPWTHVLTRTVDLAAAVGSGPAFVGFTGATGRSVSTQDVLSWHLTQPAK